ncbi:hypothetical protein, partial [Moraxella porci]|uniref:hypothetical protein n=1 Tax=Moraxella porci TaxID=1288392 RepID=UPI00244C693D
KLRLGRLMVYPHFYDIVPLIEDCGISVPLQPPSKKDGGGGVGWLGGLFVLVKTGVDIISEIADFAHSYGRSFTQAIVVSDFVI